MESKRWVGILAILLFSLLYGFCWYKGIETKLENRGVYFEQC